MFASSLLIKVGIPAVIVAVIFGFGWSCRGKQCEKKIAKKEVKIERMTANYRAALEDLAVSEKNYDELNKAKTEQNEAIEKMNADFEAEKKRIIKANEEALASSASSYQRNMEAARRQTEELRRRMVSLSVAESCHEAMVEITQ